MLTSRQIDRCFAKPVIPVFGEVPARVDVLTDASSVILQGVSVSDLPRVVDTLSQPPTDHLRLLVHIDLVTGLENNEAGLKFLGELGEIDGIVTIHHQLVQPARQLGLLSIVRVFLSDSRAFERGLKVVGKAHPDVFEVLPAAAAVKVAEDIRSFSIPHIAGGLCRTEDDIRQTLASGCLAVTSTRPTLWRLNSQDACRDPN